VSFFLPEIQQPLTRLILNRDNLFLYPFCPYCPLFLLITMTYSKDSFTDKGYKTMANTNKPSSLTEAKLAERWGLSIKTLQDWRRKGKGPPYLKFSKSVRYPIEVVDEYETQHLKNTGV
jgi:hypothetical protein